MIMELKQSIQENYDIKITEITKNEESTDGNVYIINSSNKKYVVKVYDSLDHVKNMIDVYKILKKNKINAPVIINTNENKMYISLFKTKYVIVYSFLKGKQIEFKNNRLDEITILKISRLLRKMHECTLNSNVYNLPIVEFIDYNNSLRKSILHFDITSKNVFTNDYEIYFIDFDDAKYGPCVCDVAIAVANLFFSKTRGVDKKGIESFINEYYKNDDVNKEKELPLIKEIAINWIDDILNYNNFDSSMKDSLKIKRKLIEDNLPYYSIRLVPFKKCISKKLYEMYQDIPLEEKGSINKFKDISYEQFLEISNEYILEETKINPIINTTTLRYILFDRDIPIGEIGIRTTLNDFWLNKGSQIYYKIRKSKRGRGYGNIILKLGLEEAKKLNFKCIRINCNNNNIPSKKIIINNGGKIDIPNYKTKEGFSTSYIIELDEK